MIRHVALALLLTSSVVHAAEKPVAKPAAKDMTRAERSFAVYPKQEITLRFDHGKHLSQGMDCDACHGVAASTRSSDLNLPKQADCELCHDIEKARQGKPTDPPASCTVCHPGFDHTVQKAPERWSFPSPNIVFPHKTHLDRKVDCKVCHGDMGEETLGTRQNLPKMETCLKCHDGAQAPSKCATCHLTTPDARLQTTFASTRATLAPQAGNPLGIAHGPRWEFEHGSRAMLDQATCSECHGTSDCLKCHDGLTKPLGIHPNDFMSLHPAAARTDTPRCDACHRRQSFCAGCHEQVGVGRDASPSLRAKNLRVHPPSKIWVQDKGPQHHGVAASRDIQSCASCHREETCLSCHSDGQLGNFGYRAINPHPPGFKAICRKLAAKNDRACLKCHTPVSGVDPLQGLGCR